jgi:hypothetical protein
MIIDLVASTQIAQIPVAALPTFPASAFSTTNIKPPLGASFTYFSDISLLVQKSTDVFVMDVHDILAGVAYHMANFLPGVMCSLPQLGSCFTQYVVYST